jgi:hypothetical protein
MMQNTEHSNAAANPQQESSCPLSELEMNFQAFKGVVDDQGQAYRCDLASIDSSWMSKKGMLYEAATADFAALQASGTVDSQQAPGTDTVDNYLDGIRKSLKTGMREKTLHNRSELKNDLTVCLWRILAVLRGVLFCCAGRRMSVKPFFLSDLWRISSRTKVSSLSMLICGQVLLQSPYEGV